MTIVSLKPEVSHSDVGTALCLTENYLVLDGPIKDFLVLLTYRSIDAHRGGGEEGAPHVPPSKAKQVLRSTILSSSILSFFFDNWRMGRF